MRLGTLTAAAHAMGPIGHARPDEPRDALWRCLVGLWAGTQEREAATPEWHELGRWGRGAKKRRLRQREVGK